MATTGTARLTLLDLANRRILNTIEIVGMYDGVTDRSFALPFRVSNHHYYVPAPDEHGEGAPRILNLRDLTGEGAIGQFVLLEFEACELYLAAVLGYSPHTDRAVHYAVETPTGSAKPKIVPWVEKVFGATPRRPGYWDFTWKPGHGVDGSVRERVSFSRSNQRFVKR